MYFYLIIYLFTVYRQNLFVYQMYYSLYIGRISLGMPYTICTFFFMDYMYYL